MHHLSICSKCGYGHSSDTCVTDDEVVAWFDSQSEEFLAELPGYEDGLTPRRAWNEFFCPSPATETAPASSPAPVVAGQVEGTTRVSLKDFEDRLSDLLCFLPSGRLTEDQFNETLQGMNCDLLIIQTRGFLKSAIATLAKIRSDSEQRA